MKRLVLTGFLALAVLGFFVAGRASAQGAPYYGRTPGTFGRPGGPSLSPYLDLTRGGNPAANYFLGVLPEIDRRATKAQQGAAILDLERRVDTPQPGGPLTEDVVGSVTGGLPPTGHAAAFATYSSYYNLTSPTAQTPRRPQTTQPQRR